MTEKRYLIKDIADVKNNYINIKSYLNENICNNLFNLNSNFNKKQRFINQKNNNQSTISKLYTSNY